ncbi:MAG: sterol desaturase family protein [Actinobacteria bacterium]|nr:sterol desaturase family protein [Actinomycetota bacterium]MBW3650570.1 sterol desaturase family protein [Actinomycetota bacterium]
MPSDPLVTTWLIDHAVALLAVSVACTVVGEHLLGMRRRHLDATGSATSIVAGAAYLATKALVSKGLVFGLALAVYDRRLFDLDWTNPVVWIGVFVARDFQYYWIHRAEHRVRVLWASHMVHHSLERFTFTSAVRLPWMESVYKPALWLWVPLVGFHPAAFAAIGALVLAVGQLQHTELLRRRTPLDWVFVTPATHRVHHGSNPEYLDRNFGSMLVVWDRMFGTYAAETAPVVYGLAGGKRVATPAQALLGGFPALVSSIRSQHGVRARARHLVAAP